MEQFRTQTGQVVHGFLLERRERVEDVGSDALIWTHVRTGARLLALLNQDENKVFGIGFRTPPSDSRGAAHIVEHCVLSGSRRYKTKEPFMDLIKGSLQTFLNAMTYPDKTIYPVASRNDQDFRHLMDVYLDAVFHPAIYGDGRIFRQEGWRYELSDEAGQAVLNRSGVVYNEMKGVYSDPSSVLMADVMAGLFPDVAYGYESGGDPAVIPELTEADFLDFHRRYYHPSNSYLFLYGDLDLTERLAYLDSEYLGQFDRAEIHAPIGVQPPFEALRTRTVDYAIPAGGAVGDRHYYAWAVASEPDLTELERFRAQILSDVLFEQSSGPVQTALIKSGLAEDVLTFSEDLRQSMWGVGLVNAKAGCLSDFHTILTDVLRRVADDGIDRRKLIASLNKLEFSLRECGGSATRGVRYFIQMFDTWLYGGDPLDALRFSDVLQTLRDELTTDIYEATVRSRFIDCPHAVLVDCRPVPGLNEQREQAEQRALAAALADMPPETVRQLREQQAAFEAWQAEPDSPAALATIPRLSRSDINSDILNYPEAHSEWLGGTCIELPIFTGGMGYAELSLNLDHLTLQELADAKLITLLLTELPTANYSYEDLETELYLQSGGISFSLTTLRNLSTGNLGLRLNISLRALNGQWPGALRLMDEILRTTRFDDLTRIREELRMTRAQMEQRVATAGQATAILRTHAYLAPEAVAADTVGGLGFYAYLCHLLNHWAEQGPLLTERLSGLLRRMLNRQGMAAVLTAGRTDLIKAAMAPVLSGWPIEEQPRRLTAEALGCLNEGIGIASQVQYVCQAFDLKTGGAAYDGTMQVAAAILSKGYLHNQVRAQGGAYGAGLTVNRHGVVSAYSYRDPQLERTLSVYRAAGAHLAELPLDDAAIETAVIGCMSGFDPPLTPQMSGRLALSLWQNGQTRAEIKQYLEQAIATTAADVRRFATLLTEGFNEQPAFAVVGDPARLAADAGQLAGIGRPFGSRLLLDETGVHPA